MFLREMKEMKEIQTKRKISSVNPTGGYYSCHHFGAWREHVGVGTSIQSSFFRKPHPYFSLRITTQSFLVQLPIQMSCPPLPKQVTKVRFQSPAKWSSPQGLKMVKFLHPERRTLRRSPVSCHHPDTWASLGPGPSENKFFSFSFSSIMVNWLHWWSQLVASISMSFARVRALWRGGV